MRTKSEEIPTAIEAANKKFMETFARAMPLVWPDYTVATRGCCRHTSRTMR
jgi:hypothetical protein